MNRPVDLIEYKLLRLSFIIISAVFTLGIIIILVINMTRPRPGVGITEAQAVEMKKAGVNGGRETATNIYRIDPRTESDLKKFGLTGGISRISVGSKLE